MARVEWQYEIQRVKSQMSNTLTCDVGARDKGSEGFSKPHQHTVSVHLDDDDDDDDKWGGDDVVMMNWWW